MPVQSIVTYDGLPISSGGAHAVRLRGPREVWSKIVRFLANCTDNLPPSETSMELITGDGIPGKFSTPLLNQLTEEYGPPACRRLGANTGHIWSVPGPKISELVGMIEQLKPLPVHPYKLQPISFNAFFRFRLLSPRSRTPLPNQETSCYRNFAAGYSQLLGVSQLYARISQRSTVSVFLNFPCEDLSDSFQELVEFVQNNLPFKLSQSHWKIWKLTKNGKGYVGRRIPPPLAVR